jgi:hypothetical protein
MTRAFLPTEHRALTAEQTAALVRYRARWLAIRRSTEPAHRDAAEEGVRLAYQAANLRAPLHMVWCDSPVALSGRASRASCADGPNVKSAVIDCLRQRTAARVRRRLRARLRVQIESALNPADPLGDSATDAIAQGAVQENACWSVCADRGHCRGPDFSAHWRRRGIFGTAVPGRVNCRGSASTNLSATCLA